MQSGFNINTGSGNAMVGLNAGYQLTSGINNVGVGLNSVIL